MLPSDERLDGEVSPVLVVAVLTRVLSIRYMASKYRQTGIIYLVIE